MKRALITGITGQDGSYLAELLLGKGYEVHGLVRRASTPNRANIEPILSGEYGERLHLHYGDMADALALARVVRSVRPDEVYNLAAQSHVRVSFDVPLYTADVTGLGALRLLEAVKRHAPDARYYQASSSEMFGTVKSYGIPHTEEAVFHPRSPYAAAKVFAHQMTVNYREAFGMFACCGILFNHESARRSENFVTRKITLAAARIKAGLQEKLSLGNLDAARDWGYAGDYVEAMWLMLQQNGPGDYVIATGEAYTVREFLVVAFSHLGLDYEKYVEVDQRFYRPTEVDVLVGDATKAHEKLGWKPRMGFEALVRHMVEEDVRYVLKEKERQGG